MYHLRATSHFVLNFPQNPSILSWIMCNVSQCWVLHVGYWNCKTCYMGFLCTSCSRHLSDTTLTILSLGCHDPWLRTHDHAGRSLITVRPIQSVSIRMLLILYWIYSAKQVVFTLIAGLGTGGLFFPPIILMQAAMPIKDMATSTATVGLLRQLGSTVGVSIGQAIWSTVSPDRWSRLYHPLRRTDAHISLHL
jgi:hypothetical protein